MKVYSPTSTLTFARCPQMYRFYTSGWQPKHIGRVDMAAAAGVAFAKGMEVYFQAGLDRGMSTNVRKAIDAAQTCALDYIRVRLAAGGSMGADDNAYVQLPERLEKAITKFVRKWSFPPDWDNFRPELVFPDHGNCRIDLLCDTELGPCIVDFKTKVTRPAPYVLSEFISVLEHSWQFYHYIWAARQMGVEVQSYAACVVCFEPWEVVLEQWVVDEAYLEEWLTSAEVWWERMEAAELLGDYPMSPDHSDRYGLCRYSETCLTGERLFPETWPRNLIKVERSQ